MLTRFSQQTFSRDLPAGVAYSGGKPDVQTDPACRDALVPFAYLWASGAFGTSEAHMQMHWLLPPQPHEDVPVEKSIKLIRENHGKEKEHSAHTSFIYSRGGTEQAGS